MCKDRFPLFRSLVFRLTRRGASTSYDTTPSSVAVAPSNSQCVCHAFESVLCRVLPTSLQVRPVLSRRFSLYVLCSVSGCGADAFPTLLRFLRQIFVAMVCVFGTGWPFVGIIFIPMLLNCAWLRLRHGSSFAEGLGAATASATWALMCAGAVACLATWVDSGWYGRSTSPTFNIL